MSNKNEFLKFANDAGANTLTPTDFAAMTTLVAKGFQKGVASSQQINTVFRQSAFMAAVLGQVVADSGQDALDNGNIAQFSQALTAALKPPVGAVLPFAGYTAPAGYLICDGSAISRSAYAALFKCIGLTYGSGNGSTTFNLPDYRERFPVGIGASSPLLNAKGGQKAATLPQHSHAIGVTVGQHAHGVQQFSSIGLAASGTQLAVWTGNMKIQSEVVNLNSSITTSCSQAGVVANPANDQNLPPFITCNFIIQY